MTARAVAPAPGFLSLRGVSVDFGAHRALVDVTLDLPAGEVLAVLGPSGCGKSTLLRAVAGLEPLAGGQVLVDGRDLAGVPTHRRGLALMFQDGQLFPHLSVGRNVAYPLRLRRTPSDRRERRVAELLEVVGLAGFADRMPATLSGGERQRVALARSLAVEPRVLLLDEPLSALDATLRDRLAGDVRDILRARRTTAVMVTHDHEEAFTIAQRLAVMRAGRIVQQGAIDQVWRAPSDADTARFLGYARVLRGDAAARVLAAAGLPAAQAVAVRRSALVAGPDGSGLAGVVRAARATPEQVRLEVEVEGVGEVDAVAPLGSRWGPGDRVPLAVDAARLASLGGPTGSPGSLD